jgi:hypothetical protein
MNPSLRYAATYGSLAGLAVIATIMAGIYLSARVHFLSSVWFGYLVMLVALTFIFVGVKRYRDIERGGVIRFLPAFGMGLAIAVIASLTYVLVWEAYLAATHYSFMDDYTAGILRAKRAAGVHGEALAREVAKLDALRAQYANPLFRLPMTFMEIFPVGLVVALVSAGLLRNPRVLPARR